MGRAQKSSSIQFRRSEILYRLVQELLILKSFKNELYFNFGQINQNSRTLLQKTLNMTIEELTFQKLTK